MRFRHGQREDGGGSGAVRVTRGEPESVLEEVRPALGQAGAPALSGLVEVVGGAS